METLLVYGLVLVFFLVALPIAILIIMTDPNKSSTPSAKKGISSKKSMSSAQSGQPDIIAYGIVATLLALFVVLTMLTQKNRS